jgi:hypothetical protein
LLKLAHAATQLPGFNQYSSVTMTRYASAATVCDVTCACSLSIRGPTHAPRDCHLNIVVRGGVHFLVARSVLVVFEILIEYIPA